MTYRIAFLGLGVMGYPMAGHLAKAGHDVCVYNRTMSKAEAWVDQFGHSHKTSPASAVEDCDVVFACVGNDDDVRAITLDDEGAFAHMKPGTIFVDHTTTSAALARELHSVATAQDLHFIDAPVSGGQAGAENGQLTVMIGGDEDPVHRVSL